MERFVVLAFGICRAETSIYLKQEEKKIAEAIEEPDRITIRAREIA